jgi:hypothetical protein
MSCRKIRDLITTDYLDGELEGSVHQQVEEHLKRCPACLEYKEKVLQASIKPFQDAKEIAPPHVVWEKIEEHLDAETLKLSEKKRSFGFLDALSRTFSSVFLHPKPVLAVALGAVLVLVVYSTARLPWQTSEKIAGTYLIEQVNFLNQLDSTTNGTDEDNGSLGTAIETFFM